MSPAVKDLLFNMDKPGLVIVRFRRNCANGDDRQHHHVQHVHRRSRNNRSRSRNNRNPGPADAEAGAEAGAGAGAGAARASRPVRTCTNFKYGRGNGRRGRWLRPAINRRQAVFPARAGANGPTRITPPSCVL